MATATDISPKSETLNFGGKIVFIGKLIVFFMSFGFAFPTLLSD